MNLNEYIVSYVIAFQAVIIFFLTCALLKLNNRVFNQFKTIKPTKYVQGQQIDKEALKQQVRNELMEEMNIEPDTRVFPSRATDEDEVEVERLRENLRG